MYLFLKHLHSINRWFLLVSIIISIIFAFKRVRSKNAQPEIIYRIAFILSHIQLLFGLLLFIISPRVVFSAEAMSVRITRFFLVEHSLIMIVTIILISIATIKYLKQPLNIQSHKRIFWLYLFSLLLIIAAIPWPFMDLGGSWF